MRIGERIKQRRVSMGLTVDQLAERIGKNRATMYRYENGDIENLPISVLEPLADALGLTPADLFGREQSVVNTVYSAEERALIQKYRQLDNDGRFRMNKAIEAELELLSSKAEEGAVNCG